MKIGFRNIKTAIAVFLCLVVSKILKLEYSFYAVIAAIISMESTISRSFITGKNRMLGTILGAVIGLLFALIKPESPILCAIGIVIIISLCNRLKWSKSVTIAGIVFIAIMVNMNGKNPWLYSLNRIIDTFIGITIAVLVNYFIVPPNGLYKLHEDCLSLSDMFSNIIENSITNIKSDKILTLNNKLITLKNYLKIQEDDFKFRKKDEAKKENIKKALELYQIILCHMSVIGSINDKLYENSMNICGVAKEYSDENINMFINYNLDSIKTSIKEARKVLS